MPAKPKVQKKPGDLPAQKAAVKATEPAGDEVRQGNPKWEALVKMWEREMRPSQVMMGNVTYLVLQDPTTSLYYFRPITSEHQYSTRSL